MPTSTPTRSRVRRAWPADSTRRADSTTQRPPYRTRSGSSATVASTVTVPPCPTRPTRTPALTAAARDPATPAPARASNANPSTPCAAGREPIAAHEDPANPADDPGRPHPRSRPVPEAGTGMGPQAPWRSAPASRTAKPMVVASAHGGSGPATAPATTPAATARTIATPSGSGSRSLLERPRPGSPDAPPEAGPAGEVRSACTGDRHQVLQELEAAIADPGTWRRSLTDLNGCAARYLFFWLAVTSPS